MDTAESGRVLAARAPLRLDEAARKYLGVRFQHQGRNPRAGFDCIGLAKAAVRDIGREDLCAFDRTDYGRDPHKGMLDRCLREAFGPPLTPEQAEPGDLVSMRYNGHPRHLAIVGAYPYGGLSLIHTCSRFRKVIEHRLSAEWFDQITGVYRVR